MSELAWSYVSSRERSLSRKLLVTKEYEQQLTLTKTSYFAHKEAL